MAQPLSLALFPEPLSAPPPDPPPLRSLPEREWLAVHFVNLPLEALGIAPVQRRPIALLEGEGRNAMIKGCTSGAVHMGVRPGLTVSAATVLAPALQTAHRDRHAEEAALARLANLAQRLTPTISLERPDTLLLEVAGSKHLFGDRAGVLQAARKIYGGAGFFPRLALAPTPLASLWLARASPDMPIATAESLRAGLGDIPIQALAWPPEWQAGFQRLGIRQLRDLLRLPRKGLAKRFGPELVQQLDRALGLLPDPRCNWQESVPCRVRCELPAESDRLELLLPYIDSMLGELTGKLRAQDAGVDIIWLLFKHFGRAPTRCKIASIAAHRDKQRWQELITAQLRNQSLQAPAIEIQLVTGRLQCYAPVNRSLVRDRRNTAEELSKLTGLLQARLGPTAVYGLTCSDDPRPEHAWNKAKPGEPNRQRRDWPERPLLLLSRPQALACRDGLPLHRGAPVQSLCKQERIAGAWWEDDNWQRDYFQAQAADGRRLWIYRQADGWFLHGFFA